MSIRGRACLLVLLGGLPVASARAAEPSYSILHSFQSAEKVPSGLISDGGGNLFGTTAYGGVSDGGTVFTIRTDGTGFQRLHTFMGGAVDGLSPQGSLVLDGARNLYGTTGGGGSSDRGTVFTIKEDGSGFEVLHSFAGSASDGSYPCAPVTLDGLGNLYGTTGYGGPSFAGTVFKLRTDGTGFQLLHSFAGGSSDGRGPRASLLLVGLDNLYGTTSGGGHPESYTRITGSYDGSGTIFRIKTDGTGFQLLRAFPVDANDGTGVGAIGPSGPLITDGSGNLYGTTVGGGSSIRGAVFKIGMDGSGFQNLHSFAGSASDGLGPAALLVLDRSGNLYGTTGELPPGVSATIFKVRTDATGFQILHTLADASDGTTPSGSLILVGSETLFGTTAAGGTSNAGTVFSINADGSLFQVLHAFAGLSDGGIPSASVISDGSGYLYGTTFKGPYGGTVFRIRSDGTGFQILRAFGSAANDLFYSLAPLILDRAGNLYGTTSSGGPSNYGTVFKVRTDGTGFQVLHAFLDGASDGREPQAALVLDSADNLYGTTARGGLNGVGTVFRMKADGTGFQLLHTFAFSTSSNSASEGSLPAASLVLDGLGNLYGTAASGGSSNLGTVFKLRSDGTGFHVLHSFTDRADDGASPWGSLIMDGSGILYGTTISGGSSASNGTVFKMKTDGTSFQLLHSFAGGASDGSGAFDPVILDGFGNLYGTTSLGGSSNAGTVFTVRTDGTDYRILHAFGAEASDGLYAYGSLLLDGLETLIGTTVGGGAGHLGTVFALSIGRHHAVFTPGPFVPVPVRRR
jgi:uncharacterized repeat protein (TIGR03803 family)